MRALVLFPLAALLLATPAPADPYYRLGVYDWFSLGYNEFQDGPTPLQSSGGPQSLGNGLSYSWDLSTGAGELLSRIEQSSDGSTTLSTRRASELVMRFDDVVFSDGSGSGGVVQVHTRVALDVVVSGSGSQLYSVLEMSGNGGLAGRWYAGVYSGAPPSNGVFTGIDGVNELQGVFLSNPFSVALDQPTTVELSINFQGSAGGGQFSDLTQDLVATFDPGQVFQLPGGYTANSGQAGIVDNQWAPATAVAPVPATALALRAWPNPFAARTVLSLELPRPGTVELVVHDARGRAVRSLPAVDFPAGRVSLPWDGRGDGGERLPAGRYYVRVRGLGVPATGSLTLLR